MKISAVIPVAGQGKRFSSSIPKQYMEIDGQSIIAITVKRILSVSDNITGVIVVHKTEIARTIQILNEINGFKENFRVVPGGKERQDSVYNGLMHVDPNAEIVIVHDGVRPLVSRDIILKSIEVAKKMGACIAAVPVKDTIKRTHDKIVSETLARNDLWHAQTPQTFKYALLLQAHQKARLDKFYGTDEASLVERLGYPVSIINGDYNNIKITTVEDLKIVQMILNTLANKCE
jgi:2-C-methyl-D-erythritol 4-phosphate cytidylyltransferase